MSTNLQAGTSVIVTAGITMGIGMMILAKILPMIIGSDDASNESIASLKENIWSALGLLPVGLLVFAAVIILSVVAYIGYANRQ